MTASVIFRFLTLCIAGATLLVGQLRAQAIRVDLKLVLAVDGSRSVDDGEFALRTDGIAAAFVDPEFLSVLSRAAPQGIAVTLVQWAGPLDQLQIVEWHHVNGSASAAAFAQVVLDRGRQVRPGGTDIGEAIVFGLELLRDSEFRGKRRVIDVSGDGYDNAGGRPDIARDIAVAEGVVVNGLVILNESPALDRYYANRVIGGPGAFVIEIADFTAFAAAFRRKLIREVLGNAVAIGLDNSCQTCGDNGQQVCDGSMLSSCTGLSSADVFSSKCAQMVIFKPVYH